MNLQRVRSHWFKFIFYRKNMFLISRAPDTVAVKKKANQRQKTQLSQIQNIYVATCQVYHFYSCYLIKKMQNLFNTKMKLIFSHVQLQSSNSSAKTSIPALY